MKKFLMLIAALIIIATIILCLLYKSVIGSVYILIALYLLAAFG